MYLLEHLFLLTAALYYTTGCPAPERIDNLSINGELKDSYNEGEAVTYSCYPGFSRVGQIKQVCSGGKWQFTSPRGQCKRRSCGHPGDIQFGSFDLIEGDSFVFGAIIKYTCDEGYQMVSRQNIRECTATGWSNFPPHCEVRHCPPVAVKDNVKVLSTSYDDEYSVGQVVRFECKNPKLKLEGPAEIFCKSDGEWNADPPTCVEITCKRPNILNGKVIRQTSNVYNENDILNFECDSGFRASRNGESTCTKMDWSPPPYCEEITCNQYQQVDNGKLLFEKSVYREGDEIVLQCKEGYTAQTEPTKPRVCTSNGWSPPATCISRRCDQPELNNGKLYRHYNFPAQPRSYIYYTCNDGFGTQKKSTWEYSYCTATGWDPAPKCLRICNPQDAILVNANIYPTSRYVYMEGDKIIFYCSDNLRTPDGKDHGEITCLSDGKFSAAKCTSTCTIPKLQHGTYEENKVELEIGDSLRYECKDGYKSPTDKIVDNAECLNTGWDITPECKAISCKWDGEIYQSGERIQYPCPSGKMHSGSNLTQCFYYGLGPPPACEDKTTPPEPTVPPKDPVDISDKIECAPACAPENAKILDPKTQYYSDDTVEMKCNKGFKMHGSASIQCKNGVWESPPQCIPLRKCKDPPPIYNGRYERSKKVHASGSSVKYKCDTGYHNNGSDEITCDDGKWTSPICTGISCGKAPVVLNARVKEQNKDFKHGEHVFYECKDGFMLSGSISAECIEGKWENVPTCVDTSCGPAPNVDNAVLLDWKSKYVSGERASYECKSGFSLEQSMRAEALCSNGEWKDKPVCRQIGGNCGPPPTIEFGDILNNKREESYKSGSKVTYQCPNYYVLEGNSEIKCMNGAWGKEPVCLKPCTITKKEMDENNLVLRWKPQESKIYSRNGQETEFFCKDGYVPLPGIDMRQPCKQGVVQYPKCLKRGFCELDQAAMNRNNIYPQSNPIVEQGVTVAFECNVGMVPETDLKATCNNGKITYPRCKAAAKCRAPKIVNGDVKTKQDRYDSDSSVEIFCNTNHILHGNKIVICTNGQWSALPKCERVEPCQISTSDIDVNNVQLVSLSDLQKNIQHGEEVEIVCKPGYKRQASLKAVCDNGKMRYHRCLAGDICRLRQEDMDTKNLELDEEHNDEVYYGEDEEIKFKCKEGFHSTELTGKCSAKNIIYPKCTE